MIVYLLKSALCLMILLLIHRLILQREAMHQFNRFFLLIAVIGSFLIPFIAIEVDPEAIVFEEILSQEEIQAPDFTLDYFPIEVQKTISKVDVSEKPFNWNTPFWLVYSLISLVFLIRFIRNIKLLQDKINRNIHLQYKGETLVLIEEDTLPFSFLNYIFVSKKYFEQEKLTDAIFAHEKAHVHGKHSWDILLIEALLVPLWFHPGLYLAKQAIKLNHEFIADQAALGTTPLENYKSLLLSMMLPNQKFGLASSLNFALTKKRFEMLRRRTGNSTKWIKVLSVIPVLTALVYFFSEKVTAQAEEYRESGVMAVTEDSGSQEKKEINIVLRVDGKIEVEGQIIEVAQLPEVINSKDYENTLVRISANAGVGMGHLADVQQVLRDHEIRKVIYAGQSNQKDAVNGDDKMEAHYRNAYILVESLNMEYTHKKYADLTQEEKGKLLFMGGAPEKKSPSKIDFENFKNKSEYALWIDGKVVSNEILEKYSTGDFVWVFKSSVLPNARSERFPQPYQVHLYSDKHFDETYGPNSEQQRPRNSNDTITITQRQVTWHKDISRYPDPTTEFLQKNARYEKMRNSGKASNQKSQQEQEELNQLYLELNQEYTKSSDKRKKSLKQPIPPQTHTENQKPVSTNYDTSQSSLTAFGKLNGAYQVKLNQKGLFANKSDIEIKGLYELYTSLQEKHTSLSYEDKRIIRMPVFPYARLEKDGKVIFKRLEDLTEKERKTQGC